MIVQGTTPYHVFRVKDFDTSLIKTAKITYAQKGKIVLTKETKDCEIIDGMISTRLTQEDTFAFDCDESVQIKIRVLSLDGEVLATRTFTVGVDECLDKEVLK